MRILNTLCPHTAAISSPYVGEWQHPLQFFLADCSFTGKERWTALTNIIPMG